MERRSISFNGTVQGVGFRATAKAIATRFPITGWVRNEPDGSVRLEAQGETPHIEAYLDTLRARMRRFIRGEVREARPTIEAEQGFSIRH